MTRAALFAAEGAQKDRWEEQHLDQAAAARA